jgi:hypothetical protein
LKYILGIADDMLKVLEMELDEATNFINQLKNTEEIP